MSKEDSTPNLFCFKRIFYFPRLTTKKVCALGLLIAITIVLSIISGYLRIGNFSKLSISFISVFIAAYSFGGIAGGMVAALADIISCFVNPVGPFLPQLTVIEFVYGFIYGLFFYKTSSKLYFVNILACDIFQFVANMFLKTAVLSSTYGATFNAYFITRLPMCIVQTIIILIVLILIKPFLKTFDKTF